MSSEGPPSPRNGVRIPSILRPLLSKLAPADMGRHSILHRIMTRDVWDDPPDPPSATPPGKPPPDTTSSQRGSSLRDMARSKFFYPALAGALVCSLASGAAMVLAQGNNTPAAPKPKPSPAPAKSPPAAPKPAQPALPGAAQGAPAAADGQSAPRPSAFDDNINRSGIKTCAKGYAALGQGVLPPQSEFSALFQWNKENADAHSVQSLVGIRASDQNVAGVIFAAPVGGVCEGQFVRVTPVAVSCSGVARELNPKSTVQANLGQIPVIASTEGFQILLVPAGEAACTVVLVGRITL